MQQCETAELLLIPTARLASSAEGNTAPSSMRTTGFLSLDGIPLRPSLMWRACSSDFGIPVVVARILALVSSLRCFPRLNSRSFRFVSSLQGFPVLAWRNLSLLAGSRGAANPPSRTL